MLKLVSYNMKNGLLFLMLFVTVSASAQINPDGTVINNFSATDINNNFFTSTTALNNGKHIIIDFSATWCGNCWNYHGTKVLDNYYAAYGPAGTLTQDAEVLFYEGDPATNSNDLNGVGTNTVGDWVTGSNYRIFNEASPSTVKSSFSASGTLGYPTVFVVCSDKKMYRLATSINTATAVRSFVNAKCGLTPLSTETVYASNFAYDLYPNPTSGNTKLALSLDKVSDVQYIMFSSIGQKIIAKEVKNMNGKTIIELETSNLPIGMYILNVTVGGEQITEKIIIE